AGGADGPRPLLRDLAARAAPAAARSAPPTVVVMIDRAEELFHAEGAREGQSLLELLRDLATTDDPAVVVVFAVRSDSYDALAEAKALEGLRHRVFPLAPMPSDGCRAAIERPAERVAQAGGKLEIDPDLTSALLKDLEKCGNDALPLLAFVLEQLYRVFGATKRIARADYEALGGLAGAIDAALERVFEAADKDVRIPKQQEARLALMRRGLVPWLAGLDPPTRTARRRIAGAAQIPQDARPLIDLLVGQRLLAHKLNHATGEATLELAHEALLRRWTTLKDWLDEDFEGLARLEGVKRASREWEVHSRSRAYAAHAGALLEEAERLYARPDFTARLDATDRAYLAACIEKAKLVREEERAQGRAREEQVREKSERLVKRARNARWEAWISSVGLAAALAIAGLGGWQWLTATQAKNEAQAQRERAERTLAQAADAANGLAVDLAEKFKDLSSAPAPIKADILSETRKLQEQLLAGGAKGDNLRRGESVVLNEIAQARLAMGDSAGALAAARQSAALMAALSAAEPDNAGWWRDLSVSYEKLGDVQQAVGDLEGALKSFRDDLAIATALSASDPGNAQRRWDLSTSYEKLGDLQQARNDLNGALNSYREALAIREKVSASDPGNAGWQRDLAVSLERVGATLTRQGDAAGAIAAFEQALAVYRGLARAHPDDARSLAFSIVPHWRLAELDRAKQREHLEAALAILEPLAAADRLDAKRRGWLAQIKAQLTALGQAAPAPRSPAVEPAQRQE
ncbi:MAG: tetratricopeptide repeat protein, partial [Methylocystis sp.]